MKKNIHTLSCGSLRRPNDSDDIARNPETGEIEHILYAFPPYDSIIELTCPGCKHKSKDFRMWATEFHSILWCPVCRTYSWIKTVDVIGKKLKP